MTTDISSSPADAAGASTENTSPNDVTVNKTADVIANAVEPQITGSQAAETTPQATGPAAQANQTTVPVVGADGKVAYVPNYKYKAALQEKELDPFFHPLIKDPESEKKVKELFSKVDAFDFIKGKKEHVESQFQTLMDDYDSMSGTVTRFNDSVKRGDLSSAFRLAGISKEQIFKWTQSQLQLMDMPPEQRQQYEQYEQAQAQKYDLEEKVSSLQQQYEQQAVQARTIQLEMALARPEVARFAEAWDRNGEPGSFRNFVAEEARKFYYEQKQDLSPEQAVAMVMQKFGKFLNVGDSASQSPQAIPQQQISRQNPPVIPNVTGKASSPIKKVPRSIEDLKAIAKSMR
jgi:hypothetical protein